MYAGQETFCLAFDPLINYINAHKKKHKDIDGRTVLMKQRQVNHANNLRNKLSSLMQVSGPDNRKYMSANKPRNSSTHDAYGYQQWKGDMNEVVQKGESE